jgi:hypothetical protein
MLSIITLALALQAAAPNVSCGKAPDLALVEQARSAAIAAHDAALLDRLYAPEFKGVTTIGIEVDKPTLLRVFGQSDGSTGFALDALESLPLGGGTAVSRGRLTASRDGKVTGRSRFLHVWRRFGCDWRIVAGAATPIPQNG